MPVDVAEKAEAEAEPPSHRRLDRRTVIICVVAALVAAVISGGVAAAVATRTDRPQGGLTPAVSVPSTTGFTRFDGTKGTLADYAGQKLVVNFFASTCVPCRKEMPGLQKVQTAAGDEITVIGIAVQDDPKEAAKLVDRTGATYEIGQDFTGELFNQTGGSVLPFTIFVGADGTIVDHHTGALTEAQLKKKISADLLAGG